MARAAFAAGCLLATASLALAAGGKSPTDYLSLDVPGELGNRRLAAMGLVDVTAEPFRADATGKAGATKALQAAIDFARDHQMVTFFPPGTYTVSGTLVCVHGRHDPATRKVRPGGRDWPCVLVGSRAGKQRPRIVLAANSPGFGDPGKPKYVVHFWARAVDEGTYDDPQPNISMNQMLVGVDVAIGPGNAGAVGVRHRAAQGSGVQDCTIDAAGGLCGLEGGAGSGGSHAHVTVLGGRIGADLRQTQPASTITGFTLIGQTQAAMLVEGRQTVTAVGLRIVSDAAGPAIVTSRGWGPHHGQLSLVDSVIEFRKGGGNVAVDARSSLTMHNVYVRSAAVVARVGEHALAGVADGWCRVEEYAAGLPTKAPAKMSKEPLTYTARAYVDGQCVGEAVGSAAAAPDGPPADLQARHVWPADFPTFESPGCVNVKDPPYAAVGDGAADDHAAIQRAIDEHDLVFLPKGFYAVSKTLRLRPGTRLIGVHRCFSRIVPLVRPGGDFADAARPRPLVETADGADDETVLAFLHLSTDFAVPGAYCLRWQAGRKSIFRAVNIALPSWWPKSAGEPHNIDHPLVVVTGHGGGRWYNFHQESWRYHGPNYRHLLIDGTTEPMHMYQCNPEHARGETNMEIRNARFVSIYGLKGEYNRPILTIRDSDHVRLFGYGGNAAAWEGKGLFVVERTPNFLLANLVDTPRLAGKGGDDHFAGRGVDPQRWHMVIERAADGKEIRTPPLDRPVLYRRGRPRGE